MNSTNAPRFYQEPTHDEIALGAFLAWEKDGRQSGREMHYWLVAEGQLRAARQKKADAAAAQASKTWPGQPAAPRAKAAKTTSTLTTTAARATTVKTPTAPAAAPARPARRTTLKASR